MSKYYILFTILSFFIYSCKIPNKEKEVTCKQIVKIDTAKISSNKDSIKIATTKVLENTYDFKELLKTIKEVKHTGSKHRDWFSNWAPILEPLIKLEFDNFSTKTTSYEYKKDLVFYVHTIKHKNDTISIKPFLENAQGKETEGYLIFRVLIFAMKNNKEANFIDIPEKLNPLKLRKELLNKLYKEIDSDIILCHKAEKCVYKDLRK